MRRDLLKPLFFFSLKVLICMKFIELAVITCLQDSPNPCTTHNAVRGCLKHVVLQVISPNIAQNQEQFTFVLYTCVSVCHALEKYVLSVPINVQRSIDKCAC